MNGPSVIQYGLNIRRCLAHGTIDRHDSNRLIQWLRTYLRLMKEDVTRDFESQWVKLVGSHTLSFLQLQVIRQSRNV